MICRVLEADLLHHTKELDNLKKENTDIVNQVIILRIIDLVTNTFEGVNQVINREREGEIREIRL